MEIEIHFGALTPPLSEQLSNFKIDEKNLAHYQRDADAITRLSVRGLITDSMKGQTYKKLLKNIINELEEVNK
jgi:hypothetical protein